MPLYPIRRLLSQYSLAIAAAVLIPGGLVAEASAPATDTPETEQRLPLEDLRLFAEVFNKIRVAYVNEIDDQTLLENAVRGMLSSLDPHSAYLDANDFKDLQVNTSGEFGGLGLEVGMENGFVKVISPIDGTPAAKAGVQAGDLIVMLDNKPVKGMTLTEAVSIMRGKRGSSITLTILREGLNKPFEMSIVRDIIKVISVRHEMLQPGYGYLRIANFQNNTGNDVQTSLAALNKEHELYGLILDLRNNPGGVLQSAAAVADAFLDDGMIVYTDGRLPQSHNEYHADAGDATQGAPIVVLINGGSASASEIVAGALQDHRRAVILGTQSFGKGSVQTVLPITQKSAIKLTTARYFTPNGRSIQAEGITPDILVEPATITPVAKQPRISEADLNGHLSNGRNNHDNPPQDNADVEDSQELTKDNQLFEALNLLKGLHLLGQSRKTGNASTE